MNPYQEEAKRMSRPRFLNCIMTPEVMRGIRERQEEYDKDPEAYERGERQQKEDAMREEEERNSQ